MSGQASMNGTKTPVEETATRAVARNTGEFLHDLVTLAELQLRLVYVDGQEEVRNLLWPAMTVLAGVAVGCAALPVLLIALALTLTEVAHLSPAQAAGVAAGVGLLIAGILVGCGWWGLRFPRGKAFERSEREWRQNLRWIKDALQKSVVDRSSNSTGSPVRYTNN